MYSSVSARAGEIRTLRIIGFGSISTFVGTMVEAMVLTALGALLGIAITWLFFDGLTASTIGGSFSQVVFDFRLSGANIINGFVLAMVVGFWVACSRPGAPHARRFPQSTPEDQRASALSAAWR
ncbi:FtsX-like permease family protein [Hankyongella ginsenosidimutans]|uniref:FtsX-like permease family protein n=1 Tax=Hankyongella ginsenosidimutans TaxID=1763828 RepID=UPI003CCC5064